MRASALEDLAKELGAREVDLPDHYRDAWSGLRAIMAVDMAHNLGAFVDKGGEVSTTFRALIEEGRKVTATQYLAALRDARALCRRHDQAFSSNLRTR